MECFLHVDPRPFGLESSTQPLRSLSCFWENTLCLILLNCYAFQFVVVIESQRAVGSGVLLKFCFLHVDPLLVLMLFIPVIRRLSTKQMIKCLAQGHDTVHSLSLELATLVEEGLCKLTVLL